MQKEQVKDLNEISSKLGIYPPLYRAIVAFAIVYNHNSDNYPSDEEVYNISKKALYTVDPEYINSISKNEFSYRLYAKDLVLQTVEEMGLSTRK